MTTGMMTKTIAEYFKTQPVLKAWLFGSYSRGEQTKDSDVDIIVLLDKSNPIGLKFFGINHEGQVHRPERVNRGTCPYDPWEFVNR